MLKSATAKKNAHHKALKHRPTNEHDWRLMNQLKQVPSIIARRIANIELRRKFLEGQNIRNNAYEKERLMGYRAEHRVDHMLQGRCRQIAQVRDQALADRVAQLDANPANRPYMQQNPTFRQPIIGEQARYFLA